MPSVKKKEERIQVYVMETRCMGDSDLVLFWPMSWVFRARWAVSGLCLSPTNERMERAWPGDENTNLLEKRRLRGVSVILARSFFGLF